MPGIRGLAEIVLMVRDVESSLRFYRDTLGLTVISPSTMKGPVFLRAGEGGAGVPQQIVLAPLPAGAPEPAQNRLQRGVHHIGLEVAQSDFDAERARLEGLGFTLRTGEHPF